jgi:hypothetical protein
VFEWTRAPRAPGAASGGAVANTFSLGWRALAQTQEPDQEDVRKMRRDAASVLVLQPAQSGMRAVDSAAQELVDHADRLPSPVLDWEAYVTTRSTTVSRSADRRNGVITHLDPDTIILGTMSSFDADHMYITEPVRGWVHSIPASGSSSVVRARTVRVKYAIIGAGQTGLQFLHTCLAKENGSVAIIDTREEIGGHWTDQYAFVRLHTPKQTYGIDPAVWAGDRTRDLATRDEILSHYARTMESSLERDEVAVFL